ncbi:MAG: hypothetical protein LCH54_15720 [Bacteroidetes bacterium]|nr:hypothetical protein [Bacteroidota bacterium]
MSNPQDFSSRVEARKQQIREENAKLFSDPIKVDAEINKRANLEIILENVQKHAEFSKSIPPIDLEWWLSVTNPYPVIFIREQLNLMHTWLISNPGREKTNYRRFIMSWLKREWDKKNEKPKGRF